MHTDLASVELTALPAESRSLLSKPQVTAPRVQEEFEPVVPLAHSAALLFTLRAAEAYLYPQPFADVGPAWGRHYGEAVTQPPVFDPHAAPFEWDHDRWTLNVIGHGLLGAELYYRPRRCGWSPLASFAFAASATVAWEYGFEGNGVRPSALDLVYTPIAGLLLGEGRYWGVRLLSSLRSGPVRTVGSALLDPFGELERSLGSRC